MGDIIVRDYHENTLSSVWQYGLIDWDLLHSCLNVVVFSKESWAIFHYDEDVPGGKGAPCPAYSNECVPAGTYILLTPDGEPIDVGLTPMVARQRHPTISNTQSRTDAYRRRVRARDPCCLITGLQVERDDYSRFKAAHIYPRAYVIEWNRKGYPSQITDPAPNSEVGGSSKIDSVQNALLLRSDLHDAWDNYMIAVNPDRGHVVIPFVPGYEDIAGKVLKLDHIQDPNLRPLDALFRDQFLQAVLKNMKGAGEKDDWDHENALGGGSMDLSNQAIWGGKVGKEHLEFEMAHRWHGVLVQQQDGL